MSIKIAYQGYMKIGNPLFVLILVCMCIQPVYAEEKESLDHIISKSVKAYERINDYICRFSKKELVNGKIREDRNIIFKFKKKQHFYLQWTEGRDKGVETIYVDGKYDNKLIVHLNGFFSFLTVAIDPNGSHAMKNNRHSIAEAGIGYFIKLIENNYSRARIAPDCIINKGEDILYKQRKTIPIKAVFPPDKDYYSHIVYLYIDREMFLPVKLTVFGWNNEFLEEYIFEDIKADSGLKESDFYAKKPDFNL